MAVNNIINSLQQYLMSLAGDANMNMLKCDWITLTAMNMIG